MAVNWNAEKDKLYSLLILDLDLLTVHGAWVNIQGGNLTAGQVRKVWNIWSPLT